MSRKIIWAAILAVVVSTSFTACKTSEPVQESSVTESSVLESAESSMEVSEEVSQQVSVEVSIPKDSSYVAIPNDIILESHEEGYTTPLNDFEYHFDGDKAVITKYTGTSSYLSVPNTIENLPVTIAENAFEGAKIRILILPDTLTEIPDEMCLDCKYLQSVQVPAKLVSIGEAAFKNTPALTSFVFPETLESIEYAAFWESGISGEITIPAKWKLGYSVFTSCHITKVTFENGVMEIPDCLFQNNEVLSEVYISDTVTSIGDWAFSGTKVPQVTVPRTVKTIGNQIFSDFDAPVTNRMQWKGTMKCYYNSEAYFSAKQYNWKIELLDD